jgi:alternate F1F0 ATPase F1 subunit gamma
LAGKPAPVGILVDVPRLITAYYAEVPDPAVPAERVAFGTSGHRGSSFNRAFNERHILAITQAICLYRKLQATEGPLFLGIDTHALSTPAFATALEVLAANGVEVTLAALPGKPRVWAVGERVHARLTDAGLSPLGLFTVPSSVQAITPLVGQIQIESEAHRAKGDYTQLFVFHNRPQSGALYEPVSQRLLPLDAPWAQGLAKIPWPTKALPEVVGGGSATLRALIREYLFISLFRACAESLASENASRLAAMQRADKNIDDLLETLHGTFHRLRQSGIDEELFDVISGFEALSKEIAHRSSMSRQ